MKFVIFQPSLSCHRAVNPVKKQRFQVAPPSRICPLHFHRSGEYQRCHLSGKTQIEDRAWRVIKVIRNQKNVAVEAGKKKSHDRLLKPEWLTGSLVWIFSATDRQRTFLVCCCRNLKRERLLLKLLWYDVNWTPVITSGLNQRPPRLSTNNTTVYLHPTRFVVISSKNRTSRMEWTAKIVLLTILVSRWTDWPMTILCIFEMNEHMSLLDSEISGENMF